MKLSVIIVNYNVKHYLDNCLCSVKKALTNLEGEIIVVDNASTDGSDELMSEKHLDVQYIYLDQNLGFSKANNLGISKSTGELVLLLNPDTIVQEDTFAKSIAHFDQDTRVGGLGIRMFDGAGNYLPESKRGLPTPEAAFYKLSGLSTLFPMSKRFGQYHTIYLDQDENHDIEILSGAYMMIRKEVLNQIGLLDEDFFMYGEDIDLSYRIVKAGYINRYCADSSIIHYKGESTKKDSVNYVFVFYRAMAIFAKKHFEKNRASLFGTIISVAIYLRAGMSLFKTLIGKHWPFLLDFAVIYCSFYLSTELYASFQHKDFSDPFIGYLIPVYALVLSVVFTYSGAQDTPYKRVNFIRGWLAGLLILLSLYALLPEAYRFSRAVVLIGSVATLTCGYAWRYLRQRVFHSSQSNYYNNNKRILVYGNQGSLQMAKDLLTQASISHKFIGLYKSKTNQTAEPQNSPSRLWIAAKEFKISEVIIDPNVVGFQNLIRVMIDSGQSHYETKVMLNSRIISADEIYEPHQYASGNRLRHIELTNLKRLKRSLDTILSLVFIATFPIGMLFVDRKLGFITNAMSVFVGSRTWVGHDPRGAHPSLPKFKEGIIHPNQNLIWAEGDHESAFNGNVEHLCSTPILSDLNLIMHHFENLGD